MDIDNMPAGREMDVLIAERVMGLNIERMNGQPCHWTERTPTTKDYHLIPRYSTDIAAAWQVVEHLNNRKWPQSALCVIVATHHNGNLAACMIFEGRAASHKAADTFVHLPDYDTAGFFVDTKSRDMSDWFKAAVRVQAETAPLAICRAALKAMEAANG